MKRIILDDEDNILAINIPESQSGDTVTYEIVRISDGSVITSGSMTFVRDEMWRVAWTPTVSGIIALKVNDTTIDRKAEDFFLVVTNRTVQEVYYNDATTILPINIPLSVSGDTVTYEIVRISDGSVITSGSMTFVRDEMWRVAWTPSVLGVVALKVYDATLDTKEEVFFNVMESEADAAVSDDVPTTQELLDNVRKAINSKLTGGAVQSYSIAGRSVQNYSITELMNLEKTLINRLAAENASTGGGRNYAKFVHK